jgi:hypothetical protein
VAWIKKRITPSDFGALLYSNIKYLAMSPDSTLCHKKLMAYFNEDPDNIKWSYFIEIIIFYIFCTFNTLSKNYQFDLLQVIMDNIIEGFTNHLAPVLKPELDLTNKQQIVRLLHTRLQEYGECLKNEAGAGPAWHLGLKAYWNIIGKDKEEPFPPQALSMYALSIQNIVNGIIKDHRVG